MHYKIKTILFVFFACFTISNFDSAKADADSDIAYIKKIMAKMGAPTKLLEEPKTAQEEVTEPQKKHLEITQFLYSKEHTVLINGGSEDGIVEGAQFNSFRPQLGENEEEPLWVLTGKLKAIHVDKTFTVAEVAQPGDHVTKGFFPRGAYPMAGDRVSETRFRLVKNPIMTPSSTLLYDDLFLDPKSDPNSFELSEEGKLRLDKIAERYKNLHVPILMIEGYTDANGPKEANQVESYQRALTVRQYLIDAIGFAPSRVIAVGYGESDITDSSNVVGYRINNRRIVFKVNVHAQAGIISSGSY